MYSVVYCTVVCALSGLLERVTSIDQGKEGKERETILRRPISDSFFAYVHISTFFAKERCGFFRIISLLHFDTAAISLVLEIAEVGTVQQVAFD